jgi:Fur family iron response transcriptional regulator
MERTAHTLDETSLRALLREHGVTPTAPRVAIARCVLGRCDHPTADDVYEQVRRDEDSVAQATVYNTLHRLVEVGLLCTVQRPGDTLRYDPNTAPHHHLYDVETGIIHDLDAETVAVALSDELRAQLDVRRISVMIEGRAGR